MSMALLMLTANAQEKTSSLIYVGDPMCSWCYGFAPELSKIVQNYQEELALEIVMGGLRPYNTESMTDLKSFLSHHWEDVHKASGQKFKYDILERSDLAYDTEPPSRAQLVVRELSPEKEMAFFQASQEAFYLFNLDLSIASGYSEILKELNIPYKDFEAKFNSEEFKLRVKEDFSRAQDLAVSSFPTLLLKTEEGTIVVARGYAKAESIISTIDGLLEKE